MKEENQEDPSTPTAVIHKSELSHPCTPVCLRQTKCRSIVSEGETRGTQNKVVSVNGSSSQARVTPYISFAEVDSLSVVGYAVHHCILSDSLTLSRKAYHSGVINAHAVGGGVDKEEGKLVGVTVALLVCRLYLY